MNLNVKNFECFNLVSSDSVGKNAENITHHSLIIITTNNFNWYFSHVFNF